MTEQAQIEAMAWLDGYTLAGDKYKNYICPDGGFMGRRGLPSYLNDHNAVQRVIDGLDEPYEYGQELLFIVDPHECSVGGEYSPLIFQATCAQKVEAILKATGDWTNE